MTSTPQWGLLLPQLKNYNDYLCYDEPWLAMAENNSEGKTIIGCLEAVIQVDNWEKNVVASKLVDGILGKIREDKSAEAHSKKRKYEPKNILKISDVLQPRLDQCIAYIEHIRSAYIKSLSKPKQEVNHNQSDQDLDLALAVQQSVELESNIQKEKLLQEALLKKAAEEHAKALNRECPEINELINEVQRAIDGQYINDAMFNEFLERLQQFAPYRDTLKYQQIENLLVRLNEMKPHVTKVRILKVENQDRDGNCLFRSMAAGLPKSLGSYTHETMREKINKYMKENYKTDLKLQGYIVNAVQDHNSSVTDSFKMFVENYLASCVIEIEDKHDLLGPLAKFTAYVYAQIFHEYKEGRAVSDAFILEKYTKINDLEDAYLNFKIHTKIALIEEIKASEEFTKLSEEEKAKRFFYLDSSLEILKQINSIGNITQKRAELIDFINGLNQIVDKKNMDPRVEKLLTKPAEFLSLTTKLLRKIEGIRDQIDAENTKQTIDFIDISDVENACKRYIEISAQLKYWGSIPEMYSFSRLFRSNVAVFNTVKVNGVVTPSEQKHVTPLLALDANIRPQCSLFLHHEDRSHYNLIVEESVEPALPNGGSPSEAIKV